VLDEVWDKKLHFWTLFALNTVLTSLGLTLGIGTWSRLGNVTRLVEGVPTTDEEG
jgi:VanZ family protein